MNCPKCGKQNADDARSCRHCNSPLPKGHGSAEGATVILAKIAGYFLLAGSLLIAIPSLADLLTAIQSLPAMLKTVCFAIGFSGIGLGGVALVLGAISLGLTRCQVTDRFLLAVNSITLFGSIMVFAHAVLTVPASCSMGALTWLFAVPAASFQVLILLPLTIIAIRRTAASWKSKLALVHTLVLGITADLGVVVIILAVHGRLY